MDSPFVQYVVYWTQTTELQILEFMLSKKILHFLLNVFFSIFIGVKGQ
jgi:hypothetical protein